MYELIELHSEGMEQLAVGFGGIDVSHHNHIAALVEERDDLAGLDLAGGF